MRVFSASDLAERAHWKDYVRVYEDALRATSTPWAPWYVVPADHRWVRRRRFHDGEAGCIIRSSCRPDGPGRAARRDPLA
jgi:hypothetical protein